MMGLDTMILHYHAGTSQDNPSKLPQPKHRCTCWRKPGHRGEVCNVLRCCCYKSKRGCTSMCVCKACTNTFGCRPPPSSTRRRQIYDNQRQLLKGVTGIDFLAKINQAQNDGKFTLFESLLLKNIIIYFIIYGLEISSHSILHAFMNRYAALLSQLSFLF